MQPIFKFFLVSFSMLCFPKGNCLPIKHKTTPNKAPTIEENKKRKKQYQATAEENKETIAENQAIIPKKTTTKKLLKEGQETIQTPRIPINHPKSQQNPKQSTKIKTEAKKIFQGLCEGYEALPKNCSALALETESCQESLNKFNPAKKNDIKRKKKTLDTINDINLVLDKYGELKNFIEALKEKINNLNTQEAFEAFKGEVDLIAGAISNLEKSANNLKLKKFNQDMKKINQAIKNQKNKL